MNESTSTYRVALKWGIIMGLVSIVYSTILFLTDQVGNSWTSFASIGISVGGLILAMREFRTLNQGYMTYGEGLTVGMTTSVVSGLLSSFFSLFYMSFIDTEVMAKMADKTREKLEESGLSDDQIDTQIEMMERFQSPVFTFTFGIIAILIGGLILSLIIAAFMRKNKANPFD